MNFVIDSIIPLLPIKNGKRCSTSWEMSSLMRHYLSPMDFVTLGSPNLFTNNKDGMQ